MFAIDADTGRLLHGSRAFDPHTRRWEETGAPRSVERIGAERALDWLQRDSGNPVRVPIAVIGPRVASAEQLAVAEAVGGLLGRCGLTLLCGGHGGIMEAASRGATLAGGIAVGLLPGSDPDAANPFVTIPIATGIGEARNALIARASRVVVAVGDSYGTLSEVALSLRSGTPVFGLAGAAAVDGVRHLESVETLAAALADELLQVS